MAKIPNLKIRNARREELNEVARLHVEAYSEYCKHMSEKAWQGYVRDLEDVASRFKIAKLIVAEFDGALIGAVTLYLDDSPEVREMWPPGWAGIRLLAVRPAYRGQGVGQRLMRECLNRCRRRGIHMVGLHTVEWMSVARQMYECMGFVRVPQYDFHPSPDVVVMACKLDLSQSGISGL